jgi:hypothetical protein
MHYEQARAIARSLAQGATLRFSSISLNGEPTKVGRDT